MSHKHGSKDQHEKPKDDQKNAAIPSGDKHKLNCEAVNKFSYHKHEPSKKWTTPEGLTGMFTGILAVFAIGSFILLWIQLCDARESFRIDQRPYVWIANPTSDHSNMYYEAGAPSNTISATTHFTNFGKSPALELQGGSGIEVLANKQSSAIGNMKTILPTGKEDFVTLNYSVINPVSPAAIEDVESTPHAIRIRLFWKYRDSAGARYETDICMWNLNQRAWGPCDTGNDIRDCSKQTCYY